MPRKDRSFTDRDLARLACRNLDSTEQSQVVHTLLDADCLEVRFTAKQMERVICEQMERAERRKLLKRIITEDICQSDVKTLSCKAVESLKFVLSALETLSLVLTVLAAVHPLLRSLTRVFSWLTRLVTWIERLFDRVGTLEPYLERLAVAGIALGEFLDFLAELCEEQKTTVSDETRLNDDLPAIVNQLSSIVNEVEDKYA